MALESSALGSSARGARESSRNSAREGQVEHRQIITQRIVKD